MEFKTISMIKEPADQVWETFRDRFEEIGEQVDDLEYIRLQEKKENASGQLVSVYEWRANPNLPAIVKSYIQPSMLTWDDTATWDADQKVCYWQIESHYFREKMQCSGSTSFSPAMGGRGCKLTFEGNIHWEGGLSQLMGIMEGPIARAVENVISKMVPKSFHKVSSAVAELIAAETKDH
jgi:hypothetical protein